MRPKVLSLTQLLAKKYRFLENLPGEILASFGTLTMNFVMIIYGDSGNGKSNLIMQLVKLLINHGKILYISLEEGHEVSMQLTALRQLSQEHSGMIVFGDDSMSFDALVARLKRKRSEQFIVIDSVQYFDIDYKKYKLLKALFKNKTFIFISHAKGKKPDGFLAGKIEYDATIKVRVHGLIAFVKSRLGGNAPYVIWEEGAKAFWGTKYKTFFKKPKKAAIKKESAEEIKLIEDALKHEKNNTNITQLHRRSGTTI